LQKLSFEIEKQIFPNIKDYDSIENMLKELIKILDQKKQNDLNILRQKMALKAVKHENYRTYKQDFPSPNKQRLQKLSFEIEKQIFPNIKDYDSIENMLKELIKI
jgi:hypothetical protein